VDEARAKRPEARAQTPKTREGGQTTQPTSMVEDPNRKLGVQTVWGVQMKLVGVQLKRRVQRTKLTWRLLSLA
jgi:hypothetical protein